jgi:hypothetical protein
MIKSNNKKQNQPPKKTSSIQPQTSNNTDFLDETIFMEKTSLSVNYIKRKNTELFSKLEKENGMGLLNGQNYNPLYERIFQLNDTNYNSINLNHEWYISDILSKQDEMIYSCKINNISKFVSPKKETIFTKFVPLIDPVCYICGKYMIDTDGGKDSTLRLPKYGIDPDIINKKTLDKNNVAYIDNFFVYLSSMLLGHGFMHGIEYYGSFIGQKTNYKHNIADEFDNLNSNTNFHKYMNKLFTMDNMDYLFYNPITKKPPIKISSYKSTEVNNNVDVLDLIDTLDDDGQVPHYSLEPTQEQEPNIASLSTVQSHTDMYNNIRDNIEMDNISSISGHTSSTSTYSTDSSYSSNTNTVSDNNEDDEDDSDSICDSDISSSLLENIFITIPSFPIQVICMEKFDDTLDNLIMDEFFNTPHKWYAMFMQIIMILLTYQQIFKLTHNDLHTSNIMYKKTDVQFLYYCYKDTYYKVPTNGRIYKIIDFGRAIYTYNNQLFCSDSFRPKGDASTQYNTEPYFNPKKTRIEPNYSFDIVRLACSIFDYVIEDDDKICNADSVYECKDPIKRLISEWCLDDNGKNILYKSNGDERYPNFKLYKMIARLMHKHTPDAQLERPEFSAFKVALSSSVIKKKNIKIMNIDSLISKFT